MDPHRLLITATRAGNLDEVRALIEQQGCIQTSHKGLSALHVACSCGHIEICKYLVEKGAPISLSSRDKKGWSPLEFAIAKGSKELIQCFTQKDLVEGDCSVCEEGGVLFPLSCGHTHVCVKCLKKWMVELVKQGKDVICPQKGCQQILLERDVFYILPKRTHNIFVLQLLQRLIVLGKNNFYWCPRCPSGGWIPTPCPHIICPDCNTEFCSTCGVPTIHHTDLDCDTAKITWDSELWKKTNTKPCPQCSIPIEKTGGCSHMVCRVCKFEFCWLCLRKYTGRITYGTNCSCQT